MTDTPRVHQRTISKNVTVVVYADGDLTIDVCGQGGIILEPSQLRELRTALGRLAAGGSTVISLGENKLGEESHVEWNGAIVSLFSTAFSTENVELSKEDAMALEKELVNLGY